MSKRKTEGKKGSSKSKEVKFKSSFIALAVNGSPLPIDSSFMRPKDPKMKRTYVSMD